MRLHSGVLIALAVGTLAAAPAPHKAVVPFIADDYPRALKEARARKVPIFIEAWAPW
jgi:hypothetical protein